MNKIIHGCLEIPDLFLVLKMALCSTLEINLVFLCTHVLFSIYTACIDTLRKFLSSIDINISGQRFLIMMKEHSELGCP